MNKPFETEAGPDKVKKYPEDFVARVKTEFPDSPALYDALDNGNILVGTYLQDSANFSVGSGEIIAAFGPDGSQLKNELLARAERSSRINKLYQEWSDIYEKWSKEGFV